ncbi:MAG: hypothetical protein J5722_03635 [Oscillospiraceae bacterium]|nr:hypothetical protein [Oscillospiraceae bacterium]
MSMKTFDGLIPSAQRAAFCQQFTGGALSLFSYAPEKCAIDGMLAAAHFFAPDFTLIGDCVFLTAIMPPGFGETAYCGMEQRFHGDHAAMERWVNAWSVGGFFGSTDSPLMDDEAVLTAFTDCLRYYWGQRLKALFPEREFVFETGYEIEGELGYSITFYQKRGETV